jgi:hypothetical protein
VKIKVQYGDFIQALEYDVEDAGPLDEINMNEGEFLVFEKLDRTGQVVLRVSEIHRIETIKERDG